jgi:hypothetical protein
MESVKAGSQLRPTAQAKNVFEIFAGKVFRVPDYQRNYAWTDKNLKDFWNDVKEGLSTTTEHYWGTLTLRMTGESKYCKEKETPYTVFEVVDGQQRITTLYLFLAAMAKVGKPVLRDNYVKCGDIYRLELGGLNSQFLKDLIDDNDPQPNVKTNELLKKAYNYFQVQLKEFGRLDEISEYLQRTTLGLEFVVQDPTLAVKAFESLNDRGKPLTLLDKTKSFLMFYSLRYMNNSLNQRINEVFGKVFTFFDFIKETGDSEHIEYIVGEGFTEDEVLRFFYHYFGHYAIMKYSLTSGYTYDASTEYVFEEFLKGACNHLKTDVGKLTDFVTEFLNDFERFMTAFKNIADKVKTDPKYKKLFSFLGLNARIYPLIISLEVENLLDSQMLDIIETLDLRVYKIRGTDPRAGLYKNTISQIKLNPNRSKVFNDIRHFIDEFMDDNEFQHHLNLSMYRNEATKYILWEYEKLNDPSFKSDDFDLYKDAQVEHIFAETPTINFPGSGFQDERMYDENIHRLGNLLLLEERLNKSVQNKVPVDKAPYYQQSEVTRTKKLGFVISNRGFTKSDIDSTTKDIIAFCVNRWKH